MVSAILASPSDRMRGREEEREKEKQKRNCCCLIHLKRPSITGSCRVSKKINVQGVNLWQWINYQRMRYRKNELTDRQISLLEKLPDWDWNPSLSPKTKR